MTERKILFRGFHPNEDGQTTIILKGNKIKGHWIYGDLLHPDIECGCGYSIEAIDKSKKNNCHEVIKETIGQWVKTDKNGKDVFEGDKVRDKNGNIYTICYRNFTWQLQEDLGEAYAYSDLCFYEDGDFELIGNKWESEADL